MTVTVVGYAAYLKNAGFEKHQVCSVVNQIGACDREGQCGVTLANGTKRIASYPVQGEMVCYHPRKQ